MCHQIIPIGRKTILESKFPPPNAIKGPIGVERPFGIGKDRGKEMKS
jgi:hypothetical protein